MKKLFSLLMIGTVMFSMAVSANAAEVPGGADAEPPYSIEFEDSATEGATVLSEETTIENGRLITVTRYLTKDGLLIVDTFERSALTSLSDEGTDTATRTRDLGFFGKVTVTGSFKWYTDKSAGVPGVGIAYVKCTGMSASHVVPSNCTCSTWDKDYTSEYKAFGTAYAQASYYVYENANPFHYASGTVKITCSDNGTISDNA